MKQGGMLLLSAAVLAGLAISTDARAEAGDRSLAIMGYDPVAYFTKSRAMVGDKRFELEWDGSVYRFISARHREMFKTDPERYAPQYRGLCAMGLGVKGYKVQAHPENWVIHDGRLYITQRSFGPPGFRKAPKRWSAKAAEHLAALERAPVGSALSWW